MSIPEPDLEALQRYKEKVANYLWGVAFFGIVVGWMLRNRGFGLAPHMPLVLGGAYAVVMGVLTSSLRKRLNDPKRDLYPLLGGATVLAIAITVAHYVTLEGEQAEDKIRGLAWGVFGWLTLIGMPWFGVVRLVAAYRRAGLVDVPSPPDRPKKKRPSR